MAVVLEAPARPQLTREQAAERLLDLLTEEPQSEATLGRRLLGKVVKGGVVHNGLGVLDAQKKAKQIPDTAGSSRGGWVLWDSHYEAVITHPEKVKFPYRARDLPVDEMFIDQDYQRPLTSFVAKIMARFDTFLFGHLQISDRGTSANPRYAIMDGQTRWVAARRLGIKAVPSSVYTGLTVAEEARIFARLQTQRRGMAAYFTFRANLAEGEPEAIAIAQMVEDIGYVLGIGENQLRAISALRGMYRSNDFFLERTLSAFMQAWPGIIPEARHLKGCHLFLRKFPIGNARLHKDVDDITLTSRLKAVGINGLDRRASAAKELMQKSSGRSKGSPALWMAMAIENSYLG